jgi:hypothetical protein
MRLEIQPGIGIHVSAIEVELLHRLSQGPAAQELFTDDEIKLINKLINKNAVKRRNLGSKVFYETRLNSIG